MKVVLLLVVAILTLAGAAPAETGCSVQGPPAPYGPTGFVGNAGYSFDYWSHAGTVKGDNFYQVGTKNVGPTPITIDWPDANYFRRGIASGKQVPGTCESDRNPLNTAAGLIRYGPNANFPGPVAKFYTRSGTQASQLTRRIEFLVEWESILESGEKYLAAVAVAAVPSDPNSIHYTFTNKGRPVELEWPSVLAEAALGAASRQSISLVRGPRLALSIREPAEFTVAGDGQKVVTIAEPLSIFIPKGMLLYRDNHRGLALVSRDFAR